jgi:hypothetical protein
MLVESQPYIYYGEVVTLYDRIPGVQKQSVTASDCAALDVPVGHARAVILRDPIHCWEVIVQS